MDFHLDGPPMLGYDDFVRVVIQALHLPRTPPQTGLTWTRH